MAAVYDGNDLILYINGAEAARQSVVLGPLNVATGPVRIGAGFQPCCGIFQGWQGQIDEVELFNRALSAAEINAIFLAGRAGKCKVGPFTAFAFSAFAATFEATVGPLADDDEDNEFVVNATFTLGAGSDGINPLTQDVTFQVGTFAATIPAGSFEFVGVIDGVSLAVEIIPLGADTFEFKATGTGVDLTGTLIPVTVGLAVGDDGGITILETAEVIAE